MATSGQLPAMSVAYYKINPCCALSAFPIKNEHIYYTIIDFNEVDIRIYLPEKFNVCVDKSLCLPTLKSICFLTIIEFFLLSLCC